MLLGDWTNNVGCVSKLAKLLTSLAGRPRLLHSLSLHWSVRRCWKLQEMWANEGGRIDFTRFYEQTWKIEWFSSLTQNHRLLRTWRVFSTFGDWYFKCSNSRILRMSTIRKKMPRGIPMPGTEPTPPPSEQWKKGPGCLFLFFRDYTSQLCGDSNKP